MNTISTSTQKIGTPRPLRSAPQPSHTSPPYALRPLSEATGPTHNNPGFQPGGGLLKTIPFLTLALFLLSTLIHLAPPTLAESLQFTRTTLAQPHRLFTAHLTHFTTEHFLWDTLALLLLGTLTELRNRRLFVLTLLISAPLITLGIFTLAPHFQSYRGLSGLDSALYCLLAAQILQTNLRPFRIIGTSTALLALAAFLLKTLYELLATDTLFVGTSTTFTPAPLAHLIGALTALPLFFPNFFRHPKPSSHSSSPQTNTQANQAS